MSGRQLRHCLVCLIAAAVALAGGVVAGPSAVAGSDSGSPGADVRTERVTIGTSVRGRAITVLHRYHPGARTRVVVIGSIHGDERAGLGVIRRLKERAVPRDVDLWLLRTANPDGVAADRRTNAHRVDLNRNFPYRWSQVGKGTSTWSGPAKASEPETRALRRFIKQLQPRLVVTFHQPLRGVGANDKGMRIVRAIAAGIGLPVKQFSCTGICHGSFTSWVNHRTAAVGVTVEFAVPAGKKHKRRAADTVLRVSADL